MSAIAAAAKTNQGEETGHDEGELARAHRRALLAWYGKPFDGVSDAILVDLVLTSRDPDIRRAAIAALTVGRTA